MSLLSKGTRNLLSLSSRRKLESQAECRIFSFGSYRVEIRHYYDMQRPEPWLRLMLGRVATTSCVDHDLCIALAYGILLRHDHDLQVRGWTQENSILRRQLLSELLEQFAIRPERSDIEYGLQDVLDRERVISVIFWTSTRCWDWSTAICMRNDNERRNVQPLYM